MAYISRFRVKNFKGVEDLTLNISGRHKCPVVTLVGLNESGKTTILEALSHFITQEGTISAEWQGADSERLLALVPIARKANFTGKIEVTATVVLEEFDRETIASIFENAKHKVNLDSLNDEFDITRQYLFDDGQYVKTTNRWSLALEYKPRKAKNYRPYRRPKSEEGLSEEPDLWLKCVNEIEKTLPSIAYFPTFLVDIPGRIYLVEQSGEHPIQAYYRDVLQDVLDSMGEKLDLYQHVVKRIQTYKEEEKNPNWLSIFFGRPERGMVDSVIQKLSTAISREVIGSWRNIFNRPISAKMITLDWNVDLDKGGAPYLSLGISDGESIYALHERSLGFRWFFLFLLFTRFKRQKERPTLFLFDEPAANLHARAQAELLASFDKIVEHRNGVVYSTHSTHMINPNWIPMAHIVENKAIDYDAADETHAFASPPTSISVIPYRQFVSSYPDRTSYFQPILDRLDYVAPNICPEGPVIVTEGISDFHVFSYYCADLLEERGIRLLPGLGDSGHDSQIAALIGVGRSFVIVLDDDASGRNAARRYRDKWFLGPSSIATLGELSSKAKSKKLETILSEETLKHIAAHFGGTLKPSKKEIGLYYAEANSGLVTDKSAETEMIVREIVSEAVQRLTCGEM